MSDEPVVLYVEDDPSSREVIKFILAHLMELEHLFLFEDSKDFAERLDRLSPAPTLILLDIHVKPLTGYEMLKIVREKAPFRDVPVVALTAAVMGDEIQQLKKAGFSSVLAKPINQSAFPVMIQRIMDGDEIWSI